ncbi:retrovirus-related pol polyprotein from transposon TNT 1-94 [Tanacetum coccineum]
MGLWYSKDTDMSLTAYADADHAGCQDTRRSTSGSAQFLGDKLVSWYDTKGEKESGIMLTEMDLTLEQTQQGVSYEVSNIRVISFTMKMEILLEPTSNKLMVEHAEFDESDTYVLERFDTSAGNHVNGILLKLNLPDHTSILADSNVTPTNHGRMTKPYSSLCFIANCFNAGYLKMEVKVPDSS